MKVFACLYKETQGRLPVQKDKQDTRQSACIIGHEGFPLNDSTPVAPPIGGLFILQFPRHSEALYITVVRQSEALYITIVPPVGGSLHYSCPANRSPFTLQLPRQSEALYITIPPQLETLYITTAPLVGGSLYYSFPASRRPFTFTIALPVRGPFYITIILPKWRISTTSSSHQSEVFLYYIYSFSRRLHYKLFRQAKRAS
ncbi:hypothetical protein HAX54_020384 [Datura stramonium]|uniref:Uncharacterized protein n=1 Tax=Datura stramonium TaxID=4076 RepID=A0ABS8UTA1_DATST|nr:hypothetical protein [Datura stramonium]